MRRLVQLRQQTLLLLLRIRQDKDDPRVARQLRSLGAYCVAHRLELRLLQTEEQHQSAVVEGEERFLISDITLALVEHQTFADSAAAEQPSAVPTMQFLTRDVDMLRLP
ncbi:hypothetical protein OESDEN_17100 [Oesophagostomum dentatum]|uniref:Uncharacterized protein n=1 Tax=Oesophagostomum dentatum TaxID=61180 RepID=A0A0B1SD46_OESDE|nr:hypothetical protein OESDEN_17100 [Oesophagostomum dentatum]